MHKRCMMRPQPIAAGNYAWDEVPVEKIISSEAAALRSSGIFKYRSEDCRIFATANVRPGNLRSRLQKVSPERNISCSLSPLPQAIMHGLRLLAIPHSSKNL